MSLTTAILGDLIKHLAQQRAQMEPAVTLDEANLVDAIQIGKSPKSDEIIARFQIGNFGWVDARFPPDEWLAIAERVIELTRTD